jgi:hypothetical protein
MKLSTGSLLRSPNMFPIAPHFIPYALANVELVCI